MDWNAPPPVCFLPLQKRVLQYLLEHTTPEALNARHGSTLNLITAVDRAAKGGHLDCLEALHAFGARIDRKRRNGMTPAHGAAMYGHLDVLKWLQENGSVDLLAEDKQGRKALWYARYSTQTDSTEWLEGLEKEG